jgi:ABC-2 type transport system permease protein
MLGKGLGVRGREVIMNAWLKNTLEYLRIIRVLAWKDVRDALKNRNILVIIFTASLLIVFYKALPSLSTGDEPPRVLVYDAGASALTALLEDSPNLTTQAQFSTEAAMLNRMRDGDTPELGLVIPAGFDEQLEAGRIPAVQGFVMYWMDKGEALALKDAVAAEIENLSGKPVSISTEGNTVFEVPEKDGAGAQASMAIVFTVMLIGITLVPTILLDEKQARTLDVLMVSPASEMQIMAAKALAGLFYTGAVAALALAVNSRLVMHWGLAIAAAVLFGLLAILLGLILGSLVETRAQFQLWSWVLILPMIMPLVAYLIGDLLPEIVGKILPVFPSAMMLILLRYAFAEPVSWGVPLLGLGWLLVWVIAELGIVSWLLRRRDLADKPIAAANGVKAVDQRRKEPSAPAPSAAATPVMPREAPEPEPASSSRATLRIIGAIVGKDLREAFRNRLFLSIMVGTLLIALNGVILPLLLDWKSLPAAVVLDEGKSAAVRALLDREDCRVVIVRSRAEMEEAVVTSFGTWVGIIVPADFDARAGAVDLEAEIVHYADMGRINRAIAFFESELGSQGSASVKIQIAEKRLYPSAETSGAPLLNLFMQILVLMTIGFILVPLLLVEEKESRTMDMLMASPAGWRQFLAGKTLAGLAYCTAAALVIVLLNLRMIVHWDILLAGLLLGSAFVVSIGLLIGALAGSPTAAAFWGSPLLLLMVGSVLAEIFPGASLPAWLKTTLSWSPASLILRMCRLALAGEAPAPAVWGAAAALGGMAAAVYVLVVFIMRRRYSV